MKISQIKSSYSIVKLLFIVMLSFLFLYKYNGYVVAESVSSTTNWEVNKKNPVIKVGQELSNIIWNDPSVIKEGHTYRMWLSGGPGIGANYVKIYQATSDDGLSWTIDATPVLEPGRKGDWDDDKTETPVVIKVGTIYHMYYSGFKTGDGPGRYQIGHATSFDGTNWSKDPKNPILPYTNDVEHWGFYHAAEPGAVYNANSDVIYLYYMTSKIRKKYHGKNSNLATMHGICLATSPGSDGSNFSHYDSNGDGFRDAVLVQSSHYSVEEGYRGYSTPFAIVDSKGVFHLFYDVVIDPKVGGWQQVALAHATSPDGRVFTEVEHDILTRTSEEWTKSEVRSPSVIQEGDVFKMWYAGHKDWFNLSGIGYASYKSK